MVLVETLVSVAADRERSVAHLFRLEGKGVSRLERRGRLIASSGILAELRAQSALERALRGENQSGSDRGSPNHGSTLFSKRVRAQIRSPLRVRTKRPVPWRMPPVGARR